MLIETCEKQQQQNIKIDNKIFSKDLSSQRIKTRISKISKETPQLHNSKALKTLSISFEFDPFI